MNLTVPVLAAIAKLLSGATLRWSNGVEGVILGGTELPLLLPGPVIADLPALDTTALHVTAIVARLRAAGVRRDG